MAFKFDKQTFKQEFKKKFLVRRFKVSSVATILTILLTIVATLCFQFIHVKTSLNGPLCTSNQRISRQILSYQPLNSSKKWKMVKMKLLSFHITVKMNNFNYEDLTSFRIKTSILDIPASVLNNIQEKGLILRN